MLPFKTPALAALSPAPAAELSAGDGDRSRQVDATSSAAEPARGKHALAVVKKIVEVDTSAYSNTAVDARPPIDDDEEIHLAAPSRAVAYYPKAVVNEVSILLTRKMPSPSSLRADIGGTFQMPYLFINVVQTHFFSQFFDVRAMRPNDVRLTSKMR